MDLIYNFFLGEIIIREEGVSMLPPAPPLIIRQKPLRPPTPEPLIIREVPPTPPKVRKED